MAFGPNVGVGFPGDSESGKQVLLAVNKSIFAWLSAVHRPILVILIHAPLKSLLSRVRIDVGALLDLDQDDLRSSQKSS